MFLAGAKNLEAGKDWINELNVFPVPDGDTGTNMTMTIMSAAKEVSELKAPSMSAVAKAMSSGSLRGARGNSGVILSQLLRGFCKGIRDYETLEPPVLSIAFQKAVETAYKAVMKPKEGTILTVARAFSEEAAMLVEADEAIGTEEFLEKSLAHAEDVLSQTPEMLPVLKEAGVVDSGGQGLIELLKGCFYLYIGKMPETSLEEGEEKAEKAVVSGYCVEFILRPSEKFDDNQEKVWADFLGKTGEDIVILPEDGIVKVHVHAKEPGAIISFAAAGGVISSVKIEALADGHREKVVKAADRKKAEERLRKKEEKLTPRKETGFISVAAGEGLCTIFKDLGVDCMIEGGQTMNPSTEDVLNAIRQVNADTVFVFPNNKNIILAASQAQGMVKDKKVVVIPTKTIPQGITAMINYMPEKSPEENEAAMYEEIRHVKTCQLTYAVRDTHIDDKTIHEGDIMGVGDKGILAVGEDIMQTALDAAAAMVDDESELISVYYGQDVEEADAQLLAGKLSELYPEAEVELNEGGQPIYYYILSVE